MNPAENGMLPTHRDSASLCQEAYKKRSKLETLRGGENKCPGD